MPFAYADTLYHKRLISDKGGFAYRYTAVLYLLYSSFSSGSFGYSGLL